MDTPRRMPSRRCLVALGAVVLLSLGLVWGLAGALAASSSPAPAGKVVLKLGWTSEPDNLNPFIGWARTTPTRSGPSTTTSCSASATRQPADARPGGAVPHPANGGISPDGKVWTIHLRPNVKWSDGQPLTADDVAFTYNYVVKNHMANMALTTVGITGAKAIDPTTVQIICSQPKADMEAIFLPILPQHIWEHVSPQAAATSYRQQAADRRQRPLLHGGLQEGQLRRDGPQPLLLGQETDRRQDLLRDVPERRHHGQDLKSGSHRRRLGDPPGPVQAARVAAGHQPSPTTSSTGTTSTSTARRCRARRATPCCATGASATP